MQRGRFLNLTALTGALVLAVGVASAASAQTTAGTTTAGTTTAGTTTAGTTTAGTTPAAPTATAPVGVFTADVGLTVGAHKGSGSISVSGSGASAVYTVNATGYDITGSADQGYFAYTTLPGDGGITARVLSQAGGSTGGWMKNGVMIRQSLDPQGPMAAINYTGVGKNNAKAEVESLVRTKAKASANDVNFNRDLSAGPVWLRVQRQGTTVQTMESENGKDWKVIDQGTLPIAATDPVLAGIDASSQSDTVAEMGTLDNVSVSSDIVQPNILPGPTQVVAVGGDGAVLLTYSTKTGVSYNIYRQPVGSKTAAALVSTAPTANGWFIDTGVTNGTAYLYTVTSVTKSLADPTKLLEGATSAQAVAQPMKPIGGFNVQYAGAITPATIAVDNSGVLSITASGTPIWDTSANGTFLAAPVAGDYSISAKVLSAPTRQTGLKQNSDTKVGPMIRASLGVVPGDDYAWLFTADRTDGNGVIFEGRPSGVKSAAYSETATKEKDVKYPLWLILTKKGAVITAYQSNDGNNFTQAGTPHDYGLLPALTYAGIGATSGDVSKTMTATLDANSIQIGPPFTPLAAPATPATGTTAGTTTAGTTAGTTTAGTTAATTTGATTASTTTAGTTTAGTTTAGTTTGATTAGTTAATTTGTTTAGTTTTTTTTGTTTAGTTTAGTTTGTTA